MNHEKIQKHCFIGGCVFLLGALALEFKNVGGLERFLPLQNSDEKVVFRLEP